MEGSLAESIGMYSVYIETSAYQDSIALVLTAKSGSTRSSSEQSWWASLCSQGTERTLLMGERVAAVM